MTDRGKPKLCIKFEVATFSQRKNIKGITGELQILGSHLAQRHAHFSSG